MIEQTPLDVLLFLTEEHGLRSEKGIDTKEMQLCVEGGWEAVEYRIIHPNGTVHLYRTLHTGTGAPHKPFWLTRAVLRHGEKNRPLVEILIEDNGSYSTNDPSLFIEAEGSYRNAYQAMLRALKGI